MNYFVTAIGTDSGKTVVSAILCEAMQADYWKPVQAGLPRDTDTVRNLISNPGTVFHPEQYLLNTPASPHAAAKKDHINITLDSFRLPATDNTLVIEGAGGCLVPLNDEDRMIDLMALLKAEIILVSNHYLGSINHTLLTYESLRCRDLAIKGVVFNGEPNEESERIILQYTKLKCLLRIQKERVITPEVVKRYAEKIKTGLNG
ncbi:MAG: dethiobiotin synthase [Chryseosolibacter sp.]